MIESVSKDNLKDVLPLIRKYQEFYQVKDISDKKNKEFFSQFSERSSLGCQFIYRDNFLAVAFATVYFTYTSTIVEKVGVMNDLYVCEKYRGKGIGKKLIQHCHEYALNNQAVRLQWLTAQDNHKAKKLYESMNTKKTSWDFYIYNGE